VASPFTIQASVLDQGRCLTVDDPDEAVAVFSAKDRTSWLKITYQDELTVAHFLRNRLGFHELAVEDSLSSYERPSLHEYSDHLFLSVGEIVQIEGVEHYQDVGFFLTEKSLVTVSRSEGKSLDEWWTRWQKNPAAVGTEPAMLMHALIDSIVDHYYVVADGMEDAVDELVDAITRGDNQQLRELLGLKRRLIQLRRNITPVRDMMNGLLRRDMLLVPASARPYFQDIYDHTLRLSEMTDINRETLTSALDVHLSSVSNNLNTVMKKMTVISTVLMSGALIAGIYGMNFKHMPELNWFWGYPFALILMVAAGLLILGLFRWKKWI